MSNGTQNELKPAVEGVKVPEQMPVEQQPVVEQTEVEAPVDQVVVEAPEAKEAEVAREQIQSAEQGQAPRKRPPRPKKDKPQKTDKIMLELKDLMAMDKPNQVKVLVYLAFKNGIQNSVNLAKKLKDPYLMDEFHDTLVDEVYDLLLKKKKIKKIK